MKLSQKGIDFIKSWEGFSDKPYICAGGKLTIGYGHVFPKNSDIKSISQQDAEDFLKKDIAWAEQAINESVLINNLAQHEFDALVSFVFNIGSYNFFKSRFFQRLRIYCDLPPTHEPPKEPDKLCDEKLKAMWEMIEFVHADGEIVKGLSRRRTTESWMFMHGHYYNNP